MRVLTVQIGLRRNQINANPFIGPRNPLANSTKSFVDILRTSSYNLIQRRKTWQSNTRPTDAELAILNVLWELGPSTVRQVQQELESSSRHGIHHDSQADADHAGKRSAQTG